MENTMSKLEQYKMSRTQNMPNLRTAVGEIMRVVAVDTREYTDADGEVHKVMAIKTEDGRYFRTEVSAFMEAFADFWNFFVDEDVKPEIMIVGKSSKRGNEYINFDVIG